MKILLLGINARFTHVNLALYYLRQCVDDTRHEAIILEKTIKDFVWDIISDINEIKPDVLCLSCYIWNQSHIQSILRDIKKVLPELIIICGGPDISWNPDDWLEKYSDIDFIIQGAGEKAFQELQDNDFKHFHDPLQKNHKSQNEVTKFKIIKKDNYSFSEINMPYRVEDITSLKNRYIYYEASRGCPFECSYCISSSSEQKLEYKEYELVLKELEYLLDFEPIIIKFIDRSFNVNNDLCMQILKFIASCQTKTKFHFEIHPLYLTSEQLDILKFMPKERVQLEVGIQTIHEKTLNHINRKGVWSEIKEKLSELSKLKNVHTHFDMIAGLPEETFLETTATFNEIIMLKPDHFQLGFLKILPGTKISKEIEKWGIKYQKKAPYRIFSSNTLTFDEMSQIELIENALDLVYNSGIMPFFSKKIFSENAEETKMNGVDYFLSLGKYFKKKNITKKVSDRIKIFQATFEHLGYLILPNNDFFKDCLIFDWFILSKTHFYPEFLGADCCDKFKEEYYLLFKNEWQEAFKRDNISSVNISVSHNIENNYLLKKLKNAIFFKPQTQEYKQKILGNALGAVTVDKEGSYLIYENFDTKSIKLLKNQFL